jgi:hypothetical protein
MAAIEAELRALYADASKHSAYQSIPTFVSDKLKYREEIDQGWRGDHPRLRYLLRVRQPSPGEHWGDFGANTGFFTLSLARDYPATTFTAIEANPNHATFIRRLADYFELSNVRVVSESVGVQGLRGLPAFDFLLHLNVLHHAGHDFDATFVPSRDAFPDYAVRYLGVLRERVAAMLFQLGSNWGGAKTEPLIGVRDDDAKLALFSGWLQSAGWRVREVAYAERAPDGDVTYAGCSWSFPHAADSATGMTSPTLQARLDAFPGEFYRRPLFVCSRD